MNISSVKTILPDNDHGKGRLAALGGGLLLSFDSVFIRLSGVGGVDTAFLFGLFSAISMALLIQITDPRGLVRTLVESGWARRCFGAPHCGQRLDLRAQHQAYFRGQYGLHHERPPHFHRSGLLDYPAGKNAKILMAGHRRRNIGHLYRGQRLAVKEEISLETALPSSRFPASALTEHYGESTKKSAGSPLLD